MKSCSATGCELSAAELRSFDTNGFIGPFVLYSPDEMQAIHKTVRAHLLNRKYVAYDVDPESASANYDRHLDISKLSEHSGRPEIVGRLRSILGNDVL